MLTRFFRSFAKTESFGGILLLACAALAFLIANSPAQHLYQELLDTPLVQIVNDGLMTFFFLLVGLEIKREMCEGELNSASRVALPAIAAFGGMLVPALIYALVNRGDPIALKGWGIPVATDIAFSLGILSFLSTRVPLSLKVFLTALAIFDDLGAILVIAIFYTSQIAFLPLILAALAILPLVLLNRRQTQSPVPFLLLGIVLWLCLHESGIHATLAGVIVALAIPVPLLQRLERTLHPGVAFGILPLFAFLNAGVSFGATDVSSLLSPVLIGIAAGLFFGKQIGIFLATFLAVKSGLAPMPKGANWNGVYGISLVCGVGFTMSLFVGSLAFEGDGASYTTWVRLGVLSGSLLSGVMGYLVLSRLPRA